MALVKRSLNCIDRFRRRSTVCSSPLRVGVVTAGLVSLTIVCASAVGVPPRAFGAGPHAAAPRATSVSVADQRVSVVMTARTCRASRRRVASRRVFFKLTNRGPRPQAFSINGRRSRLVARGHRSTLGVSFERSGRFRYKCAPRPGSHLPIIKRGTIIAIGKGTGAPPPPPPPPGPVRAWRAELEIGALSEWSAGRGGGEYNSGGGDSVVAQAVAHSGSWSAKQTIDTRGGSAGTRLFRWAEYRTLTRGQAATTSVWVYIPQSVSIGGYFNLYQFKSKTQDSSYIDVFFQLNLLNRADGSLYLKAAWGCGAENPNFPHGPYANSTNLCTFFPPRARINVPVGRWFKVSSQIVPSSGYGGSIKFWQDGVLLYDFQNVMTGYPNTNSVNGVDTQWAVNAYGRGLRPSSYVHYVDDADVSRG
jgi:hypothetical protein